MSSVEVSDIDSSDDEDHIIAKMETKSGLPQAGAIAHPRNGFVGNTTLKSETPVATVKMSGGVMKRVDNLYDSSESENEDIMQDRDQSPRQNSVERTYSLNANVINNSKSSSNMPPSASKGSISGEVTINGKSSPDSNENVFLDKQTDTVINDNTVIDKSDRLSREYKESRFNPFDRDLHVDEDHFEELPVSHQIKTEKINRLKSDSNASSQRTNDSHPVSEDSDDITFADLGLSEDHFSQPEGYFGLSSTEELEMAIETCKEMILVAPKGSDKQKNLVKTLVQLRLKLQELKEGPVPVDEGVKVVVGHKFTLRSGAGSKHYCEKCNGVIWGLVQQWYRCTECGYCTHAKCLNLITRTCASVKVLEEPTYCLSICPERGLSSQNYRCAECRGQISYKSGYSEPRMCDYSGNYYCELCHWNDSMLIPARVLHNWDFDEWKVCRASKQYLRLMETKAVIRVQDINPMLYSYVDELNEVKVLFGKWLMETKAVIRVQDINPMLYSYVDELNEVKKLREELLIMKKYILICAVAMSNKLLLQLKSRQHFVESSDIYSMRDLMDVQKDTLLQELAQVHSSWAQHIKTDCEAWENIETKEENAENHLLNIYSMRDLMDVQKDTLLQELAQVHSSWAQHIKTDCELCRAKGFICELCDQNEILFPFDNIALVCSECSYVIHRHCFSKRGGVCPRCERRNKRKNN